MSGLSPSRRFAALLAAIVIVGLGLRVGYVLIVTQHDHDLYDATYYELQAEAIVAGHGFNDPFALHADPNDIRPAADHPPLTVAALLPGALFGSQHASNLAMRFTMALIGAATIVVIGLLGRLLGGQGLGLLAAAIAAFDPNLWMNDGLIMSESLAVLLTTLLLFATYRVVLRGTTRQRAVAIGAIAALATLTRIELALLIPALAVPAIVVSTTRGQRLPMIGATLLVFVLVLAPWCAFNIPRFEKFAPISTNGGLALQSANCDNVYFGSRVGYINVLPPCAEPNPGVDESVWDARLRANALAYLRGHLTRYPVVVLARLARSWNLFHAGQTFDLSAHEGRPVWASWTGAVATWLLAPLAAVGALARRRPRPPIWPLATTIVIASAVIALFVGGLVRYRATAEPAMVVLAAAGAVSLWTRWHEPATA